MPRPFPGSERPAANPEDEQTRLAQIIFHDKIAALQRVLERTSGSFPNRNRIGEVLDELDRLTR